MEDKLQSVQNQKQGVRVLKTIATWHGNHGTLITMSYLTTVTYLPWQAEEKQQSSAYYSIFYFNNVKYPTKPELANSSLLIQTVMETPCSS